ncbi:hypothetical protein D3C78_1090500 [compost metagenome]
MRVVRVDHQRHAEGFEAAAGQFRSMGAGRRWKTTAEDMGKVDATLFNHRAVFYHTGATATARRPGPGVFDELRATVFGFQGGANTVLQVEQVGFYGLGAGRHVITLNRAKQRGAPLELSLRKWARSIPSQVTPPQLTKIKLRSPIGSLVKRPMESSDGKAYPVPRPWRPRSARIRGLSTRRARSEGSARDQQGHRPELHRHLLPQRFVSTAISAVRCRFRGCGRGRGGGQRRDPFQDRRSRGLWQRATGRLQRCSRLARGQSGETAGRHQLRTGGRRDAQGPDRAVPAASDV